MMNSIRLVFLCFYLLFRTLFRDVLKLGQKYNNILVRFLVQIKNLNFALEIYWPLYKSWNHRYNHKKVSHTIFIFTDLYQFGSSCFHSLFYSFIFDTMYWLLETSKNCQFDWKHDTYKKWTDVSVNFSGFMILTIHTRYD